MDSRLLKRFRLVATLEGISFLVLLFVAMPLKYFAGMPKAVSVVGMAHGLLFVAYMYLLYECWQVLKWPFGKVVLAGISSVLPFGTFWFDRRLKQEQLAAETA
jgi:integral membrane protein